jgi:hypothetical protein
MHFESKIDQLAFADVGKKDVSSMGIKFYTVSVNWSRAYYLVRFALGWIARSGLCRNLLLFWNGEAPIDGVRYEH